MSSTQSREGATFDRDYAEQSRAPRHDGHPRPSGVALAALFIFAVAALVAAFGVLLAALLWHPGCCCCCANAQRHDVASIVSPPAGVSAPPKAAHHHAIPHDTRAIVGLPAVEEKPKAVIASIHDRPHETYHAPVNHEPFDFPPGVPAFGPPAGHGPDVGPPIHGYEPPPRAFPVNEPSSWAFYAIGSGAAMLAAVIVRRKRNL